MSTKPIPINCIATDSEGKLTLEYKPGPNAKNQTFDWNPTEGNFHIAQYQAYVENKKEQHESLPIPDAEYLFLKDVQLYEGTYTVTIKNTSDIKFAHYFN